MRLSDQTDTSAFGLSNKLYDFIKFLTVVLLPALGTLYFGLAQIWNLPSGEEVLGTLMVLQVFIGAVMGISTKAYENSGARYSGVINTTETPEKLVYSLDLKDDPETLQKKDEVIFKVNPS